MRTRSTPSRVKELSRWITKNRKATVHDFVRETGGRPTQYYHIRANLGLAKKNPALSDAMKKVSQRRKEKTATDKPVDLEAMRKDNEEFLAGKPQPKQEVVVEGNTPDFIWYEMDLMQRRLGDVSTRLNHVMKVAHARDADQKKMMRDLINENTTLRVENNNLKHQVSELTEMINGTPI
jgi:hypothetical protein